MLEFVKERANSDDGAVGTVEAILLVALAVFGIMAVSRYIMGPISTTSIGIGEEIESMNPRP